MEPRRDITDERKKKNVTNDGFSMYKCEIDESQTHAATMQKEQSNVVVISSKSQAQAASSFFLCMARHT